MTNWWEWWILAGVLMAALLFLWRQLWPRGGPAGSACQRCGTPCGSATRACPSPTSPQPITYRPHPGQRQPPYAAAADDPR